MSAFREGCSSSPSLVDGLLALGEVEVVALRLDTEAELLGAHALGMNGRTLGLLEDTCDGILTEHVDGRETLG